MPLAMARPWKHPNTGIYWLRCRVPVDLRARVGKREEKRSLGTRDPTEAKRLHSEALAAVHAQWSQLRRGPISLDRTEAAELARLACRGHAEDLIDDAEEQLRWRRIGSDLWRDASKFPATFPDFEQPDRERLKVWCIALAEKTLAVRGLLTDEAGKIRLARYIARAMHRASMTLEGGVHPPFMFDTSGAEPAKPTGSSSGKQGENPSAVHFHTLLVGWASEKRPAAKTVYAWGRVLDQLGEFVGHTDALRLTTDDLHRWKAALLTDGLRAKTIRDGKLAPLRAVLSWGLNNGHLAENVGGRVSLDAKARPSERKRSYNDEEARIVLSAAFSEDDDLRRWVPWVCAYTGARVSEVCQLRGEDVFQQDGIWCIHFAPEAGSLKNAGSERILPIHPALLETGFTAFVKRMGPGPLFVHVKPDRFGSRGGNGTKVLGRWIRSLGIDDARISPSHSWRHRFRTLGRKHDLAPAILDAITGHSQKSVGDAYGEFPLEAMWREMLKIPTLKLAS